MYTSRFKLGSRIGSNPMRDLQRTRKTQSLKC